MNQQIENWQRIWNSRANATSKPLSLTTLIELDGFDSGAGYVSEVDWLRNVSQIISELQLSSSDSLYEVGCGSGAFLLAVQKLANPKIGGLDYSESLIEIAKLALPGADLSSGAADLLPVTPSFDYVISHAVFHYFHLDYAERVLRLMAGKARKSIAIFEIPDLEYLEQSETVRRAALSKEDYDKKYSGLPHTYYSRTWLADRANSLNCKIRFLPSFIPNSVQSPFRYGVIMEKNL